MKQIIAHISDDGLNRIQTNEDHCHNVAEKAAGFARDFGMDDYAFLAGLLHDKGKERKSFQDYIKYSSGYDRSTKPIGDKTHSWVGADICRKIYGPVYDNLLVNQILSHHSVLHNSNEIGSDTDKDIPCDVNVDFGSKIDLHRPNFANMEKKDFHHLSRMLFSCLIDADRLDTEAFMNPDKHRQRQNHTTLKDLLPALESYLTDLQQNSKANKVNEIREKVQRRCVDTSCGGKGFYSLNVPTGGGKTLSSLVWAIKHAIANGQRRIIIAIPYTSIVMQTARTLKDIFGEENVLEHHSAFDSEKIKENHSEDKEWGDELLQKMELATENWDFPIIVTTNVQLFESIYSGRPSVCRKLHNIVNSVIILDEVQTLSSDYLQPIVDSLKTYNKLFGVSVLFTTASLPILSGIISGCNPTAKFEGIDHITEIIPEEWKLHQSLRRVELKTDNSPKSYDEVATMIAKHRRVLCVVNTRRDAQELYNRLYDLMDKQSDKSRIVHLSKMMCSCHIEQTIANIKEILKSDDDSPLRVISTSLIEAGVDLDFPVVYRQEAGLDSVLQAAGRCNREGRLEIGTAYVFSLQKEHNLPSGKMSDANNARLGIGNNNDVDWFAPETMQDYFRQLYCRTNTFDKKDIASLLYDIMDMRFKDAYTSFHLIEDEGMDIIVNYKQKTDNDLTTEDSMTLVEELKKQGPSYSLMKKLGRYTIRIYKNDFNKLKEMGVLKMPFEGIYVLYDPKAYDPIVGLKTENHWLDDILNF